jgi:TolA-binding protein
MKNYCGELSAALRGVCFFLIICSAVPVTASEYLLYSPKAATAEEAPANPSEGILVRTVTVKKGDTLKAISRRYNGRSSYFPQILLFNRITRPDLIHVGDRLLVPLSKGKGEGGAVQRTRSEKVSPPIAEKVSPKSENSERELYGQGKKAYKKGEYSDAAAIFTRFLNRYPGSTLAPDAYLARGDCYLKLSGR